jgi:hypothetical protein
MLRTLAPLPEGEGKIGTQVNNLRYSRALLWNDLGCGIAPGALAVGVDGGDAEPEA